MTDSGWPDYHSKSQEIAVLKGIVVNDPPKAQKYIRLGTIRQVRYELAAVYREARQGQLASGEATRLTYILNMLAQMMVDDQLEERISALETGRD